MMRRDFLTATPAVFLAGAAGAARADDETPIGRMFNEWRRLHDHSNEPGISDEECGRRVQLETELEKVIAAARPLNAQDVARKALIAVGLGVFELPGAFWAEMCSLADFPVSEMMIPCFEDEVAWYSPAAGGAA